MKQLMLLIAILIPGTPLLSAEPAPEEDYQILQGKWTRSDQDSKGSPLRVEQEISNKISKVSMYDRNGKLLHSHQAKFRLQRMREVSLFTYFDLEVLEGPNKGRKQKTPVTFVYRIKDNRFIQVEGILKGDKIPTRLITWWKVKPPVPLPDV
ncbi:MAG: hypothetical protein P1V19_17810 [Gimesia sp.]|nr:hypothetical protein [Gimesia sp.]